ncbi:hypothetical protein ACSBR2_040373 [Camellia fascicularis]
MLMFLSSVFFFLASPFYVKVKVKSSLVVGFFQVIVASYKNRSQSSNVSYYHKKGSMLVIPSENLRTSDRWICPVDQVEELKSLVKLIPLWSTGIMIAITISQNSFPVLQASSMDRHITSNFEIPAGSSGMFLVISLTLWIALYDRVILPLASEVMGKPAYLSRKQRLGIGLCYSSLSMVVTAIVECIRRAKAIEEGYSDNSHAVDNMSALWLVAYFLNGLAEAFNGI